MYYFMTISKYIDKLESQGGLFSTTYVSLPSKFNEFISNKKVVLVNSHSTINDEGKRIYVEKLFKTIQGFYIYLNNESESKVDVTLYYKEEQSSEFDLFIGQLLKQFKKN